MSRPNSFAAVLTAVLSLSSLGSGGAAQEPEPVGAEPGTRHIPRRGWSADPCETWLVSSRPWGGLAPGPDAAPSPQPHRLTLYAVRKGYPLVHLGEAGGARIPDIMGATGMMSMAVSGPPVLEAATGEKATPEELGGWELHARRTGQVDLFVDSDEECLALVRRVLAYLPSNASELPPAVATDDPRDTRHEVIRALRRARGPAGEGGRSQRLLASWPTMF